MPKPYIFKDVFIQFLDINSTPRMPGDQIESVNDSDYLFLTRKDLYEDFQYEDSGKKTREFLIRPFPVNRFRESEVFRRYMQTKASRSPEYWFKQVPFYARLLKHELTLEGFASLTGTPVKIDSYAFLNALGWSVRVEIRVKQDFSPMELQVLIKSLRDPQTKPYVLNERSYSLRELFKVYKDAFAKDGYEPAADATRPNYWHLTFIDTPEVSGTMTPPGRMMLLDLESLVEVLFPLHREIIMRPNEYGEKTPQIPGLTTTVFGNNISFSDFNTGTFTFFQDTLNASSIGTQVICYGKNVADFTWLTEQWINYRKLAYGTEPTAEMEELIKNGFTGLNRLKLSIRNPSIQEIFSKHKELAKLNIKLPND